MTNVNIVLFDDFTVLDAFGPAEVFGRLSKLYQVAYFSPCGGLVVGSANTAIETKKMSEIEARGILVLPGGFGTRPLVDNDEFIGTIKSIALASEWVLCVCTGSALLSKTGLLDGKNATSNKISWEWVVAQNAGVNWVKKARWVVDGKYYTSSGITAGIDMSLGFVSDRHGVETARKVSASLEHIWNEDNAFDPFAEA